MKEEKMKFLVRFILIILIIINCITIFKFSNEQAEKSSNTSGKVIDKIVEINPKMKKISDKEKNNIKENMVTPVRKMGHFTIYSVLGMLLFLFTKTFNIKDLKSIIISFCFVFLYACTDEIHQIFVDGRSGEFRDVCIDCIGALFGIFIIYVICWKIEKTKKQTGRQ